MRNPDLQNLYGKSGNETIESVKQQYIDYGFASKANVTMDNWDQPWYCGEYDPKRSTEVTQCGCTGKIHMGAVND